MGHWAEEIRRLLEEDYPQAGTISLVCDNLNTHDIASLYPLQFRRNTPSSALGH